MRRTPRLPPDHPRVAPARMFALCTDSARPQAAAEWWTALVGGDLGPGPDGTPRYLHGAAGLGDTVWKFVPVDDARRVRNRWRWSVYADVADLVAAGATVLHEYDDELGSAVLADPDGNEFRACSRGSPVEPQTCADPERVGDDRQGCSSSSTPARSTPA